MERTWHGTSYLVELFQTLSAIAPANFSHSTTIFVRALKNWMLGRICIWITGICLVFNIAEVEYFTSHLKTAYLNEL